MKSFTILILILDFLAYQPLFAQENETQIVDLVWLKDGSKLTGTILKWELQRGMEFKLITGAVMEIPKEEIRRVAQHIPLRGGNISEPEEEIREPKAYDFKEKGWYQNTSGFINTSYSGGAGIHHVMGYRFNRMFGIGLGTGVETHDFSSVRNIIPIYVEARGFLLPQKITPYYALKIGYGIAMKEKLYFDEGGIGTAKGGFHFSPELGVRFGAGDVSYYLGLEYKIQNATYKHQDFFGGGAVFTDKISYRRIEIRTGLLF